MRPMMIFRPAVKLMPKLIRDFNNRNAPIVSAGDGLNRTYFNLVRLSEGETYKLRLYGFEAVWVVQCM